MLRGAVSYCVKRHVETILRGSRARYELQACITEEGTQRWQVSLPKLPGKRADRGQGCQIKEHPREVLVPGLVLQGVDGPRALLLVAAGNDDMPVGVRGGERASIHIPQPGGPSRENDCLRELMC